ncbi:hypothetical protein JQ596_23505 [Bradyrhizobium manausense]|uniref:hypothetical protein n=1 Tax=Bradyrhizobium TaxID=374 RepID=UPI001BA81025|nr:MULTISPECIES: hypothetical protein [Bradyrhizobium]MBR0828508.1 hypothetical protein [Bradyrhizobium manausense]UVO33287.1 hypothetical protein KUF59_19430 [Bradyrhizobium arachidis]
MEPRRIIRTDIAASALAHLTLVGLIILISEVHPFHAAPTETVSFDIVTPEQLKEEEAKEQVKEQVKDKPPEPPLDLKLPKLDVTEKKEAAAEPPRPPAPAPSPSPMPEASSEPPKQQPQPPSAQKHREANAQPQAQPRPAPQPPPQAAAPAYIQPEPDVTLKYGVMLGLPPELPAAPKDATKDASKDDGGAAQDSMAAKLAPEVVAEFRRHLRSCTKLPDGVAPTDKVHIKLRTVMATDGTLAREPILIEASASPAKGLAMLESAKSALLACQPYKMLPADKYQEWKVLDLSFTPRDFGAS